MCSNVDSWLSDDRMAPDILVLDFDGRLLCVVEIGYTRPEKLGRYQALGIPDVRWYAKGDPPPHPMAS